MEETTEEADASTSSRTLTKSWDLKDTAEKLGSRTLVEIDVLESWFAKKYDIIVYLSSYPFTIGN